MKCHHPLDPRSLMWPWITATLVSVPLLFVNSPRSMSASAEEPGVRVTAPIAPTMRLKLPEPIRIGLPDPGPSAPSWDLDQILVAIRHVETGGCPSQGTRAIGDGGHAIGPFQIHRAYWQDSNIPGLFEDCFDATYARKVMVSYWKRYCPEALQALDAEVLARVHNGGPTGSQKASTLGYWRKVERTLTVAKWTSPRSSD